MRRLFLFIFFLFLSTFLPAEAPIGYLETPAEPGDGIYRLMRRYQLDEYSCNFEKFYALNQLKSNAPLKAGKIYKLPIFVYTFNGSTIRSTIGIDDWDLALGIQRYNEDMLRDGLRQKSFKANRLLWVPFHTLNCGNPDLDIQTPEPVSSDAYDQISNPDVRTFPIFGESRAYTPLKSNKLQGQIFYIVSGHGGKDSGALGKRGGNTLCEDEYAYDVALRLCRKLIEHGATAYMIIRDEDGIRDEAFLPCDEDETVWGGAPVLRPHKGRLYQRSNIINDLYKKNKDLGFSQQKTIVIHVDSRSKNERIHLFFYHQKDNETSRELSKKMQQSVKANYEKYRGEGYYSGKLATRDLHMLREVEAPTVYIELANIRNPADQQRIVLASNRALLASWLFEGLTK
ncbi:MAG TPA: N-acetylmuramoyl-L-alanine amidase [Saprospiraceae bacterium]|nr:N-acetylmuramoyl-L-alanine amidase [Saprospiraceae bacterium]